MTRGGRIALAVWALLIAAAFIVGDVLLRARLATEDGLPPLHAEPRLLTWQILPAVAFAAGAVAVLPNLARRLPWKPLLLVSWVLAVAWTIVLAISDGLGALARPLDHPTEYPAGLGAVRGDPGEWLRTFTERLNDYPTHVRGHPPLPTLVLWALEAIGLRGTGWAAALIILVGGSAIAAIAITVRHLAGEDRARQALPFLVLAPFALWIATAMDAFFLGVGAWGAALLAIAAKKRVAGRKGVAGKKGNMPGAVAAGLLLGCLPYLSYGLLPFFAVPLAVLIAVRPNARVVIALLCGLAVVPVAFTLGGFWWPDGVAATTETYRASRGSAQRIYLYFLFANLAVLGLLIGPAVAYALPAALRRPPIALLCGAGLVGVIALDLSGVTRGEVERIWVPCAAWIVVAAALHRPPSRGWLAAQAATALIVQALVLSHW